MFLTLLTGMEYIFGTFNKGLPVMVLMYFNRFSLNVMRLLAPDSIIDELKIVPTSHVNDKRLWNLIIFLNKYNHSK